MRTVAPLILVACLIACGDAAPYTKRGVSPAAVSAAAPRVVRVDPAAPARGRPHEGAPETAAAPVPAEAATALEDSAALHRFFDALSQLDEGRLNDDVRIVQFGDSHTAADYETGPIRRALQARFGDGGRGFVQMGKPWKWYTQEGLRRVGMQGFVAERGKIAHGAFAGDGMYGLSGVSIEASRRGARAWTELSLPASRFEIDYLRQPDGGSVDVLVDGVPFGRVSTRGRTVGSGYQAFDVPEAPHQLEIAAVGDGKVRVLGVNLERARSGIALDALGINGARIANFLTWSEPHLAEQLHHRAPALVILAYGTNEAGDDSPIETYERQLVDALGRVARAVPSASCLLLGPPDRAHRQVGAPDAPVTWETMPRLLEVVAAQRRVAAAAGCAFYDQLGAMGGPGSIATWALEAEPRAMADRVHLSREGYAVLGRQFARDVVAAYSAYRADHLAPPVLEPPPVPLPPLPSPAPVDPDEPIARGSFPSL